MATNEEKRRPPVGNFVAASGEKPMAIDRSCERGNRFLDRATLVPTLAREDVAYFSWA